MNDPSKANERGKNMTGVDLWETKLANVIIGKEMETDDKAINCLGGNIEDLN